MNRLPLLDVAVLVAYLAGATAFGCWFARRAKDTEAYTAADRSLPGWAIGLSIFGSYISSISFLANPGKSLAGNWNAFAFTLATPIAAVVAVRWFVPFYRSTGEVSAYAHLERRFGPWARTYAVACYLLTQMARTGTIILLLSLATSPLLGWDVRRVILMTGLLMTLYTALGGIEAAVWVGVVQAIVLLLGPVICLVALAMGIPGGLTQVVSAGVEHGKFGLGSLGPALAQSTFWVVFLNGIVTNLSNFGIDQGYVQRYATARSERDAARSVYLGALLYVPVAAIFFFIGTALWAFVAARPDLLPEALRGAGQSSDRVFPWFISTQLPPGLAGLVVAGIFAASMDSSLNSLATLTFTDVYRKVRPRPTERESMLVLRLSTVGWGALATVVALVLVSTEDAARKNILDRWWELAGIFSGGMLGLFLLGLLSRRASSPVAATAVVAGALAILWMTASLWWPKPLGRLASPFHAFLIPVVGTATILLAGLLLAHAVGRRAR